MSAYSKIHCPVNIILGKCCSRQQDLISSVVGVWVVIQVVREDLTGLCFFLQSIKVKNRKFSVMRIYSCNLFGKNSGNKQTLHFSFKIQYISRLERTTKCCKFDFMYSPDHCPHLIPNDLSLLLL